MHESHLKRLTERLSLRFWNSLLAVMALTLVAANGRPADLTVTIDGQSAGRTFEGIGALSAGASSRLLREYPEPQRRQILDLLFKPNFGASFHHLKVEIGGDVNSTDGTEPSPARTREEFEHPRPEYFDRGYEGWLLREARQRNPALCLDILQWGAPAWIGGGGDNRKRFYSQDNADFIAAFIQGTRKFQGVEIEYCGIWNETPRDLDWIKRLRRTLDQKGLSRVKIIASDETGQSNWDIAKDMLRDRELSDSIYAVGAHYTGYKSPPEALQTGKPLWASEDGPWRGDGQGARALAKMFNRNYILGKMTKTVIWSLVTSYYDVLPLPNSGPMKAKEPWSGHFEIQPALWAVAHTTQFIQPGWQYLDQGCGMLPGEGSYVALRRPGGRGDYSIVLETVDATSPQTVSFKVTGGLTPKPLHVWRSDERSQFNRLPDIAPVEGAFSLTLAPGSIYSLTTTSGQRKGSYPSLPAQPFPFPYSDDFESTKPGRLARFFSDQGGVFEVARRPDGQGQCLRQVIARNGIDWHYHPTPEPYSLIGSPGWKDYEVSADAWIEKEGAVSIWGRVTSSPQTAQPAQGYWFKAASDGHWELMAFTNKLASGTVSFAADQWHRLNLSFSGSKIRVDVDQAKVTELEDATYQGGLAGLGTGWNNAMFDNFAVRPAKVEEPAGNPAVEPWLRERLEWFQDQKFGFMMHFGVYSQWGCIESWPLVEEDKWARPDDLKAWTDRDKDLARFQRDYWALSKTFNPEKFDPRLWARAAKAAGMKYVVFTTKHHDGFSLFDTRLSDYRITSAEVPFHSNARSNVVREVFNAFRREKFGIGAYFSKADWHCPDYWDPTTPARTRNPNYSTALQPDKWKKFVQYTHGQIEELMTGYGPIDILWLDAGQVRPPEQDIQMDRLAAMARAHQPRLIIVDRTVGGRYENYRTPEQEVPDKPLPYVWESCLTMGDQWSFKPGDKYKSTHRLIHLLVDIVGKGGNFLLNVGPQPDGQLPEVALSRMKEIGAWMKVNGEAIYGTRAVAPYKDGQVVFTRKGHIAYAIYLAQNEGDPFPDQIKFAGLKPKPGTPIHLLGLKKPVSWRTEPKGATSIDLPSSVRNSPPCQHAIAVKFEMADPP